MKIGLFSRGIKQCSLQKLLKEVLTKFFLRMKRSLGYMESCVTVNQRSLVYWSWRLRLCPLPVVLFPIWFLSHVDLKHLNRFQSFVITYINKCSDNFVFVCKKHYVASVFMRLILLNAPLWNQVCQNLKFQVFVILPMLLISLNPIIALAVFFLVQLVSSIKTPWNVGFVMQPVLLLSQKFQIG